MSAKRKLCESGRVSARTPARPRRRSPQTLRARIAGCGLSRPKRARQPYPPPSAGLLRDRARPPIKMAVGCTDDNHITSSESSQSCAPYRDCCTDAVSSNYVYKKRVRRRVPVGLLTDLIIVLPARISDIEKHRRPLPTLTDEYRKWLEAA